jgi:hypothetical protein
MITVCQIVWGSKKWLQVYSTKTKVSNSIDRLNNEVCAEQEDALTLAAYEPKEMLLNYQRAI